MQQPNPLPIWHPAWWIATSFGIGKMPFAPGTWGSLPAFPIAFLGFFHFGADGYLVVACILLLLTVLGVWASHIYCQRTGIHDAKEVVIDEVVGQLLVLLAIAPTLENVDHSGWNGFIVMASCFLLFRLFDITKPWPISIADTKVGGGIGIMLDDLLAAIYAIAGYYAGYQFFGHYLQGS